MQHGRDDLPGQEYLTESATCRCAYAVTFIGKHTAQTRQAQHAGDIRADTVLAGGGFHAAPRPSSRCVDPSPQLLKLRAVENDDIEIMAA
ncbi:unnamed protein product [Pieris macdunnoughi]|uniref:Uncharacterized protein n=1 Tax=Pieris macdunnoughi TaxID=345717 RepID=A0A821SSG1_9NEOP|nr:unnamed protein product [Pieris macdunnoughi]